MKSSPRSCVSPLRSFVSAGYAATPVGTVAQRAGVSAQTVCTTFGTKQELLTAAYDVALAGDDEPVPLAQRSDPRCGGSTLLDDPQGPPPRVRGRRSRSARPRGAVDAADRRGGAAGDPDLVLHQQRTDGQRLVGTLFVAGRVAELGALAPGLTVERARDRVWTLNSVGVWHLLTTCRGGRVRLRRAP